VNGKLLAHGRAEEIMRRAVGGNGVGDVPKPKHRRPCPKGWRVIDGGAKAAVPALVALAAVGVVLLVIAGGAVAVPSMRDGYSAQAATRPHLRPLVHPSHFATASPPPLPPVRTRHCHDREGDLHAVLLADERRACRDDDAAQDAREAAAGKAAPRPSPAATVTPSRSGTPAPPSPSPAPTLPQTSPAAVPPPAPTPSATPVDPGAPDDGQ
jgi:hypothetical protein